MNKMRSWPTFNGTASGMRSQRRISTAWTAGDTTTVAATASSPSSASTGCFMGFMGNYLLEALAETGHQTQGASAPER